NDWSGGAVQTFTSSSPDANSVPGKPVTTRYPVPVGTLRRISAPCGSVVPDMTTKESAPTNSRTVFGAASVTHTWLTLPWAGKVAGWALERSRKPSGAPVGVGVMVAAALPVGVPVGVGEEVAVTVAAAVPVAVAVAVGMVVKVKVTVAVEVA